MLVSPNKNLGGKAAALMDETFLLLFTFKFIYLLTPYSTVLLEKLTTSQPVKKFPAFFGTRRFIATISSAHHPSLF
jgi:hypothetical protein